MFAKIRTLIVFAFLLLLGIASQAQDNNVKGFVYEKATGEPMMFCNVYLKGTTYGASTDINGFFNITKIPDGDYLILVTNLGYPNGDRHIFYFGEIINEY